MPRKHGTPSTHAAAAGQLDVQAALRMQATAREDLPRITPLHQPGAWMTQQSGPFQMPCAPALSPVWSLCSPAAGHPWQQTSHKPASHEWDAHSHLPGLTCTVKPSGPGQQQRSPASCTAGGWAALLSGSSTCKACNALPGSCSTCPTMLGSLDKALRRGPSPLGDSSELLDRPCSASSGSSGKGCLPPSVEGWPASGGCRGPNPGSSGRVRGLDGPCFCMGGGRSCRAGRW